MSKNLATLIILIGLALIIRLPHITQRPLHVDEAVNAYIMGQLIETGSYSYNPGEFHGPALYFFSLPLTYLYGSETFAQLDEFIIRFIIVLSGLAIVIFTFLTGKLINYRTGVIAAILACLSPILVYFNRYFIHESLLVAGAMGMIYFGALFIARPQLRYALATGFFLGLVVATKETWIIYMAAIFGALIICKYSKKEYTLPETRLLIYLTLTSCITILVLYSSFFNNWQGITAFFSAFPKYFTRGTATPQHTHPWYYYLKILFFSPGQRLWFFSEMALLLIAVPGITISFRRKIGTLSMFIIWLAVIFLLMFSVIPYKTPWNILGFIPLLCITAAAGIMYLYNRCNQMQTRIFITAAISLLLLAFCYQSWQINYRFADDPDNPYTYGHARSNIFVLLDRMKELSQKYPELQKTRIDVLAEEGAYWPLPWYLRKYSYVAWHDSVHNNISNTPVVLISPKLESDFATQIYQHTPIAQRKMYVPLLPEDVELRPQFYIRGYMHKELWEKIYYED